MRGIKLSLIIQSNLNIQEINEYISTHWTLVFFITITIDYYADQYLTYTV